MCISIGSYLGKMVFTPLAEEIASETSKESACSQSSITCEVHSFKVQMDKLNICQCRVTEQNIFAVGCHLQDQEILPILNLDVPIELVPNSNAMIVTRYVREEKVPIQLPITCLQWPKMKQSAEVTERPSKSPKLSGLDCQKVDKESAVEYSSSHDAAMTPLPDGFASINHLCYSMLRSNGLIGDIGQSSTSVEECDGGKSMLCKKCMKSGNSLKMLICDLCGEAFHKPCCIPKKGELPGDYWFCKPCSLKVKDPERALIEKFINREGSRLKAHKYLGHISSMLQGKKPHTSRVRVGKEFQAEVPTWPYLQNKHLPDSPGESIELVDPAEHDSLDTCNSSSSTPLNNWLQCRETVLNSDGKEIKCGKWRRAPASETQTENWDCSCVLPWDSIHADCAVPQEVETEVVLKELERLKKVKTRVDNRRKLID